MERIMLLATVVPALLVFGMAGCAPQAGNPAAGAMHNGRATFSKSTFGKMPDGTLVEQLQVSRKVIAAPPSAPKPAKVERACVVGDDDHASTDPEKLSDFGQ